MAKKKKKEKKINEEYAHNPAYCMIRPDPNDDDDDNTVSTGQS